MLSNKEDIVEVQDIVNTVREPDSRHYSEAVKSTSKDKWIVTIDEELKN